MATNTGVGPSRRSHTKSRKGCKTCKRRHIRCDETFPQCRNCTKHQVRCDYMDAPPSEQPRSSPPVPDAYWSPEVESLLESWQQSGEAVLGDFSIDLRANGHTYTKSDLHLIYYALSSGQSSETREFTVWTATTAQTLMVSRSYPFLVHSILAFSAQFLAWEKSSAEAKSLAYHHGGIALKGLQQAISSFSKENSDAVLLSSILLSWQANDWRSYASLMAGIKSVVKSMSFWKEESMIPHLIEEQELATPHIFSATTPLAHTEAGIRTYISTLQQIYMSLEVLQHYIQSRPEESKWIDQLRDYVQRLLAVTPAHTSEEQFNHLYAFRKWLFWIPASLLKLQERRPVTLLVMAYFYAVAQELEPLFPLVAPSFCSSLTVRPLQEILDCFELLQQTSAIHDTQLEHMVYLLNWPKQAAAAYHARRTQFYGPGYQQMPPSAFEDLGLDLVSSIESSSDVSGHHSPAFMSSPGHTSTSDLSSIQASPFLGVPGLPLSHQSLEVSRHMNTDPTYASRVRYVSPVPSLGGSPPEPQQNYHYAGLPPDPRTQGQLFPSRQTFSPSAPSDRARDGRPGMGGNHTSNDR